MKKAGIIGVAVIVVIVGLIAFVPRLIDWNGFKPEIAAAVKDATGRDLEIDGDIALVVLPRPSFSASGIRVRNAPGQSPDDMASIAAVSGEIRLLPLITGKLYVESFVVEQPVLNLAIDERGRPNWAVQPAPAAADRGDETDGDGLSALNDIALHDIRIDGGSIHFHDQRTGQTITADELDLAIGQADFGALLTVALNTVLNDQPVALTANVDSPGAIAAGEAAALSAKLNTEKISAAFDASLVQQPLFGLDGAFNLDIPSFGAVAEWLDWELPEDPGPLRVSAKFATDGAKTALQEAKIEGEGLTARAEGSVEAAGEVTRVEFALESGVLDVDRYLGPLLGLEHESAPAPRRAAPAERAPARDAMAEPLDLDAFRMFAVDGHIAIEGVKAAGYSLGPLNLTLTLAEGQLSGELTELRLYGGNITGRVDAGADGNALDLGAKVSIDQVDVGEIASVASDGPPPIVGVATGTLDMKTSGGTPGELLHGLLGGVEFRLAGAGAAVEGVGDLTLALERRSLDVGPRVLASAIYNKKKLDLRLDTASLDTILGGDRFKVDLAVESEPIKLSYAGDVVREPVPSLDGTFGLDVPSVNALAAWLGRSLAADLGALQAKAVFDSSGGRAVIREASIKGKELSADIAGSVEQEGAVTAFSVKVKAEQLNLDPYLAAFSTEGPADAPPPERSAPDSDPFAGLSDEPIDLAFLSDYRGDLEVDVARLNVAGFAVDKLVFVTKIEEGGVRAQLERAEMFGGQLKGTVDLAAKPTLGVDAAIDLDVADSATLAQAMLETPELLSGPLKATVSAQSKGESVRALVRGLASKVALQVAAVAPPAIAPKRFQDIRLDVEIPGGGGDLVIDGDARLITEADAGGNPIKIAAKLGAPAKLMAGETYPIDLQVMAGEARISVKGTLDDPLGTPRPNLAIDAVGPSVSTIAALAGAEVEEVGPFDVKGTFESTESVSRMTNLKVILGPSDLAGEATIDLAGEPPSVQASLMANLIDLDSLGVFEEDEAAPAEPPAAEPPADTGPYVFTEDPLPFEPLRALDADIKIKVASIRLKQKDWVRDLDTRVKLDNGKLVVDPFKAIASEGQLDGQLTVDAGGDRANIAAKFSALGVAAGPALREFADSEEIEGIADINVRLTASGNSARALASGANGRLDLVVGEGVVNMKLLDTLTFGARDIVGPLLGGEKQTKLECLVARFGIKDGLVTSEAQLFDTSNFSLVGQGTIDLKTERPDLHYDMNAKNPSLLSLAVPFNVKGTLKKPSVAPDAVGTAIGAAKVAGTTLNPLVALGSFLAKETILKGKDKCLEAINQAEGEQQKTGGAIENTAKGVVEGTGDAVKEIGKGLKGLFGGGN